MILALDGMSNAPHLTTCCTAARDPPLHESFHASLSPKPPKFRTVARRRVEIDRSSSEHHRACLFLRASSPFDLPLSPPPPLLKKSSDSWRFPPPFPPPRSGPPPRKRAPRIPTERACVLRFAVLREDGGWGERRRPRGGGAAAGRAPPRRRRSGLRVVVPRK